VRLTLTERIIELIEGATIISGYVEEEDGLHLVMQDGRVLLIVGDFTVALLKSKRLH
jgi:hypothetical protein